MAPLARFCKRKIVIHLLDKSSYYTTFELVFIIVEYVYSIRLLHHIFYLVKYYYLKKFIRLSFKIVFLSIFILICCYAKMK